MPATDSEFWAHTDRMMKIMEKFNTARKNRCPYKAKGSCPVCKAGTVNYRYDGPRSVGMKCDNPKCNVGLMG